MIVGDLVRYKARKGLGRPWALGHVTELHPHAVTVTPARGGADLTVPLRRVRQVDLDDVAVPPHRVQFDPGHGADLPALAPVLSRTGTAPRAVPKDAPPWRCAAYRSWVRTHPCCNPVCPTPAARIETHHAGSHGVGALACDSTCVHLCVCCHRAVTDTYAVPGLSRVETERLCDQVAVRLMAQWVARTEARTVVVPMLRLVAAVLVMMLMPAAVRAEPCRHGSIFDNDWVPKEPACVVGFPEGGGQPVGRLVLECQRAGRIDGPPWASWEVQHQRGPCALTQEPGGPLWFRCTGAGHAVVIEQRSAPAVVARPASLAGRDGDDALFVALADELEDHISAAAHRNVVQVQVAALTDPQPPAAQHPQGRRISVLIHADPFSARPGERRRHQHIGLFGAQRGGQAAPRHARQDEIVCRVHADLDDGGDPMEEGAQRGSAPQHRRRLVAEALGIVQAPDVPLERLGGQVLQRQRTAEGAGQLLGHQAHVVDVAAAGVVGVELIDAKIPLPPRQQLGQGEGSGDRIDSQSLHVGYVVFRPAVCQPQSVLSRWCARGA